ncbi:MAG: hypothetical protein ILA34_05945 [Bacteroidaceae bacterium]|nr:hypothetical protein [Bacteroidaceae bacterium]
MGNIGFYAMERKSPKDGTKKWYATIKNYTPIDGQAVIAYAVENSHVDRAVIEAAMAGLTQVIQSFLLNGHNLTVDGLGCFFISNKSKGSEQSKDVTADSVKRLYIRFRPDRRMREEMKQVSYHDITRTAYGKLAGK